MRAAKRLAATLVMVLLCQPAGLAEPGETPPAAGDEPEVSEPSAPAVPSVAPAAPAPATPPAPAALATPPAPAAPPEPPAPQPAAASPSAATSGAPTLPSPPPPAATPAPDSLPPLAGAATGRNLEAKRAALQKYEAGRAELDVQLDNLYKQNSYNLRGEIAKLQKLCQTMESRLGRGSEPVVAMYSALAIFYRLGGQTKAAAPLMKWCIDGGKKVFTTAKTRRLIPILQLHLADMYVQERRYPEARALLKEALPKVEAMQGVEPRAKQALGFAYITQSRLAARDNDYQKAYDLLTRGRALIIAGRPAAR